MTGKVVHFEIPAVDLQRAQDFYHDAFGWQIQTIPSMDYTMVTTTPTGDKGPLEPGAINGGMLAKLAPFTAPVIVIEVDDIDDALATVERHGGTRAVGRQEVGGMGFAAYFHDPEGNFIGLWQSASR